MLKKLSKEVTVILFKLKSKFKKQYKASMQNKIASFDHSTLSAAVSISRTLAAAQKLQTSKISDFKKKCKMYLVQLSINVGI